MMNSAWTAAFDELINRALADDEPTDELIGTCLAEAEQCDPEDDEAIVTCVDGLLGLAERLGRAYGAEAVADPIEVAGNITLAAFEATGSPQHLVAFAKTLHLLGLSPHSVSLLDHALRYDGPNAHTGAPPPLARLHAERGELLRQLGALDAAEMSLREALRALAGGDPGTQRQRSSVLNNLGLIHLGRGDLAQAKQCLVEALVIGDEVGESPLTTAITLDNLGTIEAQLAHQAGPLSPILDYVNLVVQQHLDGADSCYERAGRIFKTELPGSAEHYVISLLNRVDIARQRGTRQVEDKLSVQALKLAKKLEVPEMTYLHAVSTRGEVLNRHGRHRVVIKHLTPWLDRVLTSSLPHDRRTNGLTALLSASAWAGDPELTERAGRALMDTDDAIIELRLAGAPESSARSIFAGFARHAELIIGHCLPPEPTGVAPPWLYDLLLNRKGVLAERQGNAWLHARAADGNTFDILRQLRAEVARIDLDGSGEASITAARRRHGEATRQLADAESWFYRQLGRQWLLPVSTGDVQKHLPADTTLLDLAIMQVRTGQRHYVLFVVPPEGDVRYRDLGAVADLDKRIEELMALVSRPGSAALDWPTLLSPEDPLTRNLVVAPTGLWGMVPFGLLAEHHVVSTVPSGRWIATRELTEVTPGQPIVLGDPDFDLQAGDEMPFLLSMRMPKLDHAGNEIAEVAACLGVTEVAGEDATRGRLLTIRSPRVLHIATHGTFLDAVGSILEKTEPRTWTSQSIAGAVININLDEHPLGGPTRRDQPHDARTRHRSRVRWLREIGPADQMSRSGLLLSGFNAWLAGVETSTEVGIGMLSAGEFALLDLAGTELVVLSACETGVGAVDYTDGSLIGLRTAALAAGARACVSSLWKVDDASTAALMSLFYMELTAGVTPRDALHTAQTALRRSHPDPYHWAGWVIEG